jgi:hypothetical protein
VNQAQTIIGIDVGKSGGIAFLCGGEVSLAVKMPETHRDLFDLLHDAAALDGPPTIAFVENVNASPQMGVVSAFKFGKSVGAVQMACIAAGIRMELVSPQKWQKALGLKPTGHGIGQGDTEKKNRNKARAQELFPGIKITHAIADCLLIAEYGRRTFDWRNAVA